jgi:hypothetical protein
MLAELPRLVKTVIGLKLAVLAVLDLEINFSKLSRPQKALFDLLE